MKRDIEQIIRATTKERLAEAKTREAAKPADERRAHRELQQEIYRELLAGHGVRIAGDVVVADVEEAENEPATKSLLKARGVPLIRTIHGLSLSRADTFLITIRPRRN